MAKARRISNETIEANATTYAARMSKNGNQSIGNSAWTTVTGWTSIRNDGITVDLTNGLIQVPVADWYTISAQLEWPVNATGVRYIRFTLNGTGDAQEVAADSRQGTTPDTTTNSLSTSIYLTPSDVVRLMAFQSSGGSLNAQAGSPNRTYFSIARGSK